MPLFALALLLALTACSPAAPGAPHAPGASRAPVAGGAPGPAGPGEPATQAQAERAPGPGAGDVPAAPRERERIAGMSGVGAASSLRMVGAPEDEPPLRLETNYAFPDRARWWLGRTTADRRIFYRFGGRCWQLPPGGGASTEIEGDERTGLVGSMELRRALLVWPHGFAWKGDGDAREVDLGASGRIVARLADGLPVELALLRGERRVEAFVDVRWRTQGERSVPAGLRLVNGDTPVWDETFERSGAEMLVDGIFVPPDRREADTAETSIVEGLLPLPPRTTRRIALPEPLEPEAAWRAGRELHERTARELPDGLRLEAHLALELTSAGTVAAVVLRLADAPPTPPAGWTAEPARAGATDFLTGLDAVDAAAIAGLARRLGGRPAGTPYAVVEVGRAGRVQLVVPEHPPG